MAIVPSHNADELMRDDARWSDEFHAPMVRYVADNKRKSSIDWLAMASVFEAEIARVAVEEHLKFVEKVGPYFRISLPLPPPIVDHDPGDEHPPIRFTIRALPRW